MDIDYSALAQALLGAAGGGARAGVPLQTERRRQMYGSVMTPQEMLAQQQQDAASASLPPPPEPTGFERRYGTSKLRTQMGGDPPFADALRSVNYPVYGRPQEQVGLHQDYLMGEAQQISDAVPRRR